MLVARIAFVVGLTATLTATASAVATSPDYAGRGTSTRARRAPSPSKKLLAFLARVSGLRQGEGRRDQALRASLPASSLASGCGRIRFGHNPPAVRPRTRTADAPRRLAPRSFPERRRRAGRGGRSRSWPAEFGEPLCRLWSFSRRLAPRASRGAAREDVGILPEVLGPLGLDRDRLALDRDRVKRLNLGDGGVQARVLARPRARPARRRNARTQRGGLGVRPRHSGSIGPDRRCYRRTSDRGLGSMIRERRRANGTTTSNGPPVEARAVGRAPLCLPGGEGWVGRHCGWTRRDCLRASLASGRRRCRCRGRAYPTSRARAR